MMYCYSRTCGVFPIKKPRYLPTVFYMPCSLAWTILIFSISSIVVYSVIVMRIKAWQSFRDDFNHLLPIQLPFISLVSGIVFPEYYTLEHNWNKVLKCSILLSDCHHFDYLKRSYSAFNDCSSYISPLCSDFLESSYKEISAPYPYTTYSLAFSGLLARYPVPVLLQFLYSFLWFTSSCFEQLTSSFFNQYHSSAWFSEYLDIATNELVLDLSECLSPSLFDLFSEFIPFGLRIQRFYQYSSNRLSLQELILICFLRTLFLPVLLT